MSIVKVKDKTFKTSITEAEIKQRVKELGLQLSNDFKDKDPLLLCILNGSFVFAADLMREMTIPAEVSFVKLASYEGVSSTGVVKELVGLNVDLTDRHVIIIEDIIDTGRTMKQILGTLNNHYPASTSICTLFVKPDKLQEQLDIQYVAFSIPNDFIVGYGLDYDQHGRGLKEIYSIVEI